MTAATISTAAPSALSLAELPVMMPHWRNWAALPRRELKDCWRAACALVRAMQELAQQETQAVQALIGEREFVEWQHYPDADVRDEVNASQYFYHAHSSALRPFEEHGHFHLYILPQQAGIKRARPGRNISPAHLLAISMDAQGQPAGLFCVNRWVSKGPWLNFQQSVRGLDAFQVKGRRGVRQVNQLLRALLSLYRPAIHSLLQQRDAVMQELSQTRPRREIYLDRELEVLCYLPLDLAADIEALENLL
ncbi:hypothetical protein V8J88_19510 [Massilia sp. W12]|uniref:DUF6969 family protein n=1 Tax=Massilia sp. W12 TaxID=3126507 RepID=UPI0030D617C4